MYLSMLSFSIAFFPANTAVSYKYITFAHVFKRRNLSRRVSFPVCCSLCAFTSKHAFTKTDLLHSAANNGYTYRLLISYARFGKFETISSACRQVEPLLARYCHRYRCERIEIIDESSTRLSTFLTTKLSALSFFSDICDVLVCARYTLGHGYEEITSAMSSSCALPAL